MAKSVKDTKANDTIKPTRKVGRPRTYTPEALEVKFKEYIEWAKDNPRYNNRVLSDGTIVPIPTERPLTLASFAVFACIIPETFREYEKLDEFSAVCAHVRARIEADQLEGAMCEQYNPTIASRVLHLADKQDITTNGESINKPQETVQVILDPEAASIIQSIGKQSTNENGA